MSETAPIRLRHQRWHRFRNASGQTIPAYGVVEIYAVETLNGERVCVVRDNSADPEASWTQVAPNDDAAVLGRWSNAFNSSASVPNGGYGMLTVNPPFLALCEFDYGSAGTIQPGYGDVWRAAPGFVLKYADGYESSSFIHTYGWPVVGVVSVSDSIALVGGTTVEGLHDQVIV